MKGERGGKGEGAKDGLQEKRGERFHSEYENWELRIGQSQRRKKN